MTLTEFVIVYISCGSPFAVERLLSGGHLNRLQVALDSVLHLGLWPAILLVKLIRVIRSHFVSRTNAISLETSDSVKARGQNIQQELEGLLIGTVGGRSPGQTRELLERYIGLATLSTNSQRGPSIYDSEFARITDHPYPSLMAACLKRRNLGLIHKHLAAARIEFLEMLSKAAADPQGKMSILFAASDLVEQFDQTAVCQVEKLLLTEDGLWGVNLRFSRAADFEETRVAP
jgi:hypothetical protein